MPSELERKNFIDEVVIPFFEAELRELKNDVADLKVVNAKDLADLAKKREDRAKKAAKAEAKANEEAEAKAEEDRKAELDLKHKIKQGLVEQTYVEKEELAAEGLNGKATVAVNDEGHAELQDKKGTAKDE